MVPLRQRSSGLMSIGNCLEFETRKGNLFLKLGPEKECLRLLFVTGSGNWACSVCSVYEGREVWSCSGCRCALYSLSVMDLWVFMMYLGCGMCKRLSTDSPLDCVFFQPDEWLPSGMAGNAFHSLLYQNSCFLAPMSLSLLAYSCFGEVHSPVAPGTTGWSTGNTVFGTLHIWKFFILTLCLIENWLSVVV